MIAKEYIEQYGQLLGEVEDIEHKLADLCSEPTTEQFDAVQGSSKEVPYQKHSVALHGFVQAPETVIARKVLTEIYNGKLEHLYAIIAEIEKMLDDIEDVKARRIIRMRYLDGLEWNDIADKLDDGSTMDSVRMYAKRFMEKIS
nr:MAG TPA: Protein of unknown function (DUF722) [Caudoviricetes sp.]